LLFVGLTGGIGSGKSEALAACERAGAAVLSADAVVHELLAGDEMKGVVAERWGEQALSGGRVDRERVAEIVFGDESELKWLEGELWRRVGERMVAWRSELERAEEGPDIAVVEVPLLFEAGVEPLFDATVAVVADEGVRARRAAARGHHAVSDRAERQLPQEEKASRADYVVRNDGSLEELEQEIGRVLDELRKRPAS
jgi:dephospho-CoA kinase